MKCKGACTENVDGKCPMSGALIKTIHPYSGQYSGAGSDEYQMDRAISDGTSTDDIVLTRRQQFYLKEHDTGEFVDRGRIDSLWSGTDFMDMVIIDRELKHSPEERYSHCTFNIIIHADERSELHETVPAAVAEAYRKIRKITEPLWAPGELQPWGTHA